MMVFQNVDQRKVEDVVDCVESRGPYNGIGAAMAAAEDCAMDNAGGMSQEEIMELAEAAKRWIEDDFSDPQAVIESSEGRFEINRFTNPLGFDVEWVASDAWRGRYSVKSPSGWTRLSSETILSMHPTEQDLADVYEAVKPAWNDAGVMWAAVFPRTSNVFATGFELYVKKSQKQKALKVGKQAAERVGQRGFF